MRDAQPWSLEHELLARADADNLLDALHHLGLLEPTEGLERIVETDDWYRGGAETYVFGFQLFGQSTSGRFLLKACVALGTLEGTAAIVEEWVRRRSILESKGVAVPRFYGVYRSTILEEYIPYSMAEALTAAVSPPLKTSLLYALGELVGILTRCGFAALDLSDLRSRGSDIVVVDFGEDLGPPGVATASHTATLHQALALATEIVPLVASDLQALDRGFEAGLTIPTP